MQSEISNKDNHETIERLLVVVEYELQVLSFRAIVFTVKNRPGCGWYCGDEGNYNHDFSANDVVKDFLDYIFMTAFQGDSRGRVVVAELTSIIGDSSSKM